MPSTSALTLLRLCRDAVYHRGRNHRSRRLCVPAQVLDHHRGGLRHAVRSAHHHRGQHPSEEARRQEPGRAGRSRAQDTEVGPYTRVPIPVVAKR